MHPDEPVRCLETAPGKIDEGRFAGRLAFNRQPDPPTAEPALEAHRESGWRRGAGYRRQILRVGKNEPLLKFAPEKKEIGRGLDKDRANGEIPHLVDMEVWPR